MQLTKKTVIKKDKNQSKKEAQIPLRLRKRYKKNPYSKIKKKNAKPTN